MPDGSNYFCGGVVLSYNSHLLECYTRARGLVESLSSGNGEFDRFGFTLRLRIQYNLSKTIVKTQLNHSQVEVGLTTLWVLTHHHPPPPPTTTRSNSVLLLFQLAV